MTYILKRRMLALMAIAVTAALLTVGSCVPDDDGSGPWRKMEPRTVSVR